MARTDFERRFSVIHGIGSGASGQVDKAYDRENNRVVAVKTIPRSADESYVSELRMMEEIDHANIVKMFEVFEVDGNLKIVMDFCGNGNLTTRKTRMTESMILCVIRDVANALSYLHKRNIVHCDIKPQNVLFSSIAEIKVSDFGISRHIDTAGDHDLAGTIFYMAPELLDGRDPSPAADMWALGITAFELVTGVPLALTEERTLDKYIERHGTETWSDSVLGLVRKMLTHDPGTRIQAHEIADDPSIRYIPHTWIIAAADKGEWITPKSDVFWES